MSPQKILFLFRHPAINSLKSHQQIMAHESPTILSFTLLFTSSEPSNSRPVTLHNRGVCSIQINHSKRQSCHSRIWSRGITPESVLNAPTGNPLAENSLYMPR